MSKKSALPYVMTTSRKCGVMEPIMDFKCVAWAENIFEYAHISPSGSE